MQAIFKDAAAAGNATARGITFDTKNSEAYLYENGQRTTGVIGGDYRWLKDGGLLIGLVTASSPAAPQTPKERQPFSR